LKRILVDKYTPEDLKVNVNDPNVLTQWLTKAAVEGPDFLTYASLPKKEAVNVTVTGAAGQISYSLLFRIAR
jgi:hypothetical protein